MVESELIEVADLDSEQWNDYARAEGWSDGFPLMMPTEEAVKRCTDTCRGDNEPISPVSPRRVVPTLRSLAANAVMAGCRADYFSVVVAALRAVVDPAYNLHGTLATTHPDDLLLSTIEVQSTNFPRQRVAAPAKKFCRILAATACLAQRNPDQRFFECR